MILPVWSILLKRTSTLPHVHLDKINDLHSCFSGVRISTYVSKMSFEIRRKIVLSLPTFIVEPTLQATLVQTCSTTLRSMRSLTTPTSTTVHSDQNFKMLSKNTLWPMYVMRPHCHSHTIENCPGIFCIYNPMEEIKCGQDGKPPRLQNRPLKDQRG